MKKLLLLLLFTASPAFAEPETWDGCEESVIYENAKYSFISDVYEEYTCSVLFAHPKNAITLLECDNDQLVQLEVIDDQKISFNGFPMFSSKSNKDACEVE